MNKIFNINLGGYPITIDEDAYHHLNKYLNTIRNHFADSEGCEDIVSDIEIRMSELLQEGMEGKTIISMKELDGIIKIMGRPEEFGADPIEDDYNEETTSKSKSRRIKTGKRIFRSPDDQVIAGVCSGIASYFGVADPLWIRLLFIVLVFGAGVSIILYPLLWVLLPVAKTAGDKLSMRGEPATVSNIAKTIEEELTELSVKINEISRDIGSKKKALKLPLFQREAPLRKGFLY